MGLFTALRHRNFRYFWIGQCISLIGTWMQSTGQQWLVLTKFHSPFLLSLVGALQFTPVLIFSLFAGVIIDKFSKRKILLFTQTTLMLLAASLATLVATGLVQYWHILVFATLLGTVNALDMPTRQSFVIELVGKEDLLNAIALNSTIFNLARMIGPAVAGMAIGLFGTAFCFYANAVSFIAVIIGVYHIKVQTVPKNALKKGNVLKDIAAGMRYISKKPILYRTLIMTAIVGTFTMNYNVLIPVLTKTVLHQQGVGYGFLMSAMGAGSLVGALTVAAKSKRGPKTNLLFVYAISISVMLMLIPLSRVYALSAFLLAIAGFFNISFSTNANSTIQSNSEDEFRGRAMSCYTLVFAGTTPLGNPFTGTVANNFGVQTAFTVNGLITLVLIAFMLYLKYRADRKNALQLIPANE